jgi:Family of unknown function (DUF6526)
MAEQSFSNHAKYVPAFHFFGVPVFAINLVTSIVHWYKLGLFSFQGALGFFVALALLVTLFSARIGMLGVQDRVIRMEERLRYEKLLPADLRPRIDEFSVAQLVSLRFASDAELPALARRVLDEKVSDRKSIKRMVQNWRPDYLRS